MWVVVDMVVSAQSSSISTNQHSFLSSVADTVLVGHPYGTSARDRSCHTTLSITLSRLYNIDFFCDYDMRWYPFDAQTCFMVMKLGGGSQELLSLIPGLLKYLGPEELTQYYVKKYTIGETTLENAIGLGVSITFGRRLLGTILTVYLPTVLLNVIGHATNFFKPFFFEAVVTVNLTGINSKEIK